MEKEKINKYIKSNHPLYIIVTLNGAEGRQEGRLAEELGLPLNNESIYISDLKATFYPVAKTRITMIYKISYDK